VPINLPPPPQEGHLPFGIFPRGGHLLSRKFKLAGAFDSTYNEDGELTTTKKLLEIKNLLVYQT
jgi:hypothetical protein